MLLSKMNGGDYEVVKEHYEKRLAEFGPNHRGVDWPNQHDLERRFAVMLDVVRTRAGSVCLADVGCGVGLMVDYLTDTGQRERFNYRGIDISEKMIEAASRRHPNEFFEARDLLKNPIQEQIADYVLMNGVLTEKLTLSHQRMADFAKHIIYSTYGLCRKGLAFNVMSSHVDWYRDDLFHWPLDECVSYLVKNISRHVTVRMDYGLYEYTVYVYRDAI